MSGGVEGAGPIQRDEKGEAMVCTGCGTTRTAAAIVAGSATAFTCCPERKMIPARTMWHAWCDANDARPSLTAPPARTYAEGVEDAAKVADGAGEGSRVLHNLAAKDKDRDGCNIHAEGWRTGKQIAAAIRLLSPSDDRTWQPPIWEKDNG